MPPLLRSWDYIHVCKQHVGHELGVRTLDSEEMAVSPNDLMLNELGRKYSRKDCLKINSKEERNIQRRKISKVFYIPPPKLLGIRHEPVSGILPLTLMEAWSIVNFNTDGNKTTKLETLQAATVQASLKQRYQTVPIGSGNPQ